MDIEDEIEKCNNGSIREGFESCKRLLRRYDSCLNMNEKKKLGEKIMKNNYREEDESDIMKMNYLDNTQNNPSNIFSLTPNQGFLKKFMSLDSKNHGVLLFHGVGVGKTCTAIQIAENFIDVFAKKVLILLPSKFSKKGSKGEDLNIFKNELFNISKLNPETKKMNSCVANRLNAEIDFSNQDDLMEKKEDYISEKYEFIGYTSLPIKIRQIDNKIKTYTSNKDESRLMFYNKLRNTYSNRVIIMDEVHHIKTNETELKELAQNLKDIMYACVNVRLIMLSATPMFDNANEIKLIMDILMTNDKRKPHNLDDMIIFEDDNTKVTKEFTDQLKYFSKNYVSYMRGENPYTFPLRLYPNVNNDANILNMNDYPTKDAYGCEINNNNSGKKTDECNKYKRKQIEHACLIQSDASQRQKDLMKSDDYKFTQKTNEKNESSNDVIKKKTNSDRLQLSNIVYHKSDGVGKKGFLKVFKETNINDKSGFEYIKGSKEILDKTHLIKTSPKIHRILDYIEKSEGIVLIYSQYIYSGVIPLALALEHIGYNKYGKKGTNNLLKKNKNQPYKNYIVISGDTRFTNDKELSNELKILNSKSNLRGEEIKVVIISDRGTEGLDLKNIREIHILEPWYNNNKLEQIYGRGIRRLSHVNLPEEEHNVTIFNHVTTFDKDIESIDFRSYRISETKQAQISMIERIIKINSIDCNFNKPFLFFDTDKTRNIRTSQKHEITNYPLKDKSFTKICDYMNCNFKCAKPNDISNSLSNIDKVNINLIDYDIYICQEYIKEYFRTNEIREVEQNVLITTLCNTWFIKEFIIKIALYLMVHKKEVFTLRKSVGHLKYSSDKYIFQSSKVDDEKISMSNNELLLSDYKRPRYYNKIAINIDKHILNKSTKEEQLGTSLLDEMKKEYNRLSNIISAVLEIKEEEKIFIIDHLIDYKKSDEEYISLIDLCIDKDTNLSVDDNIMKEELLKGLERGHYIKIVNNEIQQRYNVFDDVLLTKTTTSNTKAPLFNEATRDIVNPFRSEIWDKYKNTDVTALFKSQIGLKIYTETNKRVLKTYKLITENLNILQNENNGMVCTTGFTKSELRKIFETSSDNDNTIIDKLKKCTIEHLCVVIEYLMRRNKTVIRPVIYKILKNQYANLPDNKKIAIKSKYKN